MITPLTSGATTGAALADDPIGTASVAAPRVAEYLPVVWSRDNRMTS